MTAKHIALLLLLAASVAGDLRSYRVYNLPVAMGFAAGLILNSVTGGFEGFASALLASVIPAALLLALFALRMLGAGDIKLFCAIGAIMGIRFVFYAMAFSFLAGGVMAIGIMMARRNLIRRLKHIASYIRTVFYTQSFIPYTNFGDKSDGAKFRFSLAIAAGCAIQIVLSGIPA